jgi:hypothetical protein
MAKHLGKADVCFEQYEALKSVITPKSEHIKIVSKQLKARPVYDPRDYSIVAIEAKTSNGYSTIAHTPEKIKELAEQYLMEAIILGYYDDDANLTESKE